MIIQNEAYPPLTPNDSADGGEITFTFTKPVSLLGLGILDIDEKWRVSVTVTLQGGDALSFNSPDGVGNNGFWKAEESEDFGRLLVSPR